MTTRLALDSVYVGNIERFSDLGEVLWFSEMWKIEESLKVLRFRPSVTGHPITGFVPLAGAFAENLCNVSVTEFGYPRCSIRCIDKVVPHRSEFQFFR
jgi:hypothetical protein